MFVYKKKHNNKKKTSFSIFSIFGSKFKSENNLINELKYG